MTDALHTELLQLALQAAGRAGELLRDGRPADLTVAATKSSPIDVVTEMDLAAEKLITDLIADRRDFKERQRRTLEGARILAERLVRDDARAVGVD
ncbi:hypothetical protein ACWEGQ_33115, partial [Streptomyces seoulensis]